ncbi:MAG: DNA internalization-related competence protein ComEC/Rec2 [Burkholderiales bacterium]|nr:MAG: DNA internalization-related competence protein ComEC/Rec2 [Burkholderiales bacterium]
MFRSPLSWALAPAVVGAVLLLQTRAVLPAPAWRAFAAALAVGLLMAARGAGWRAPRLAGALVVAAVAIGAWALSAERAAQRLEQRLPADLEGVTLTLRGVVDELPVLLERGRRFGFRVDGCERRSSIGSDAGSPGVADADPSPSAGAEARRAPPAGDGPDTRCPFLSRASLTWQSDLRRLDVLPPRIRPGQRWSLSVRLRRPHATVNPGAFDRELRWLEEGIGAVGTVRGGRLLDARVDEPGLWRERVRDRVREALFEAAGPGREREAGVLVALAIGDQASIDPELWTVFNQTGVGHLMSISGLHITMVAGLGGAAVGWVWRRRRAAQAGLALHVPAKGARLLAAVGVAFAYAGLAGWGIPAQRTCFMLAAFALLIAAGRTGSIGAAVGAAATAIVLLDPWAPLAAGFWLSFGAVLAIVWVNAGVRLRAGRLARAAGAALRTQWAASLALLPLGAWFFASVSLVGPLANAVAIPLISAVVTPLALAGGAFALVSPALAAWLVVPAASLLSALLEALHALAAWPGAAVAVPRPGLAALLVTSAGCALLLAPAGMPRRAWGAVALLPLVTAPLARPPDGELRLTALDVGQGTAVVVQVGARTLVYDTGPTAGPRSDAGARVIVPWLRSIGVARPDAVVVSHLDSDHSGGARSLLKAMPPDWLASSLPDEHPIARAAARAWRCRRGERWNWGDAEFEWLHPADPPEVSRGSPTNAVSCVLRVRHPAGTLLLTGDIETAQERRLVELYGARGLAADVLVVPHHGSATSSTDGFVDAVSPRWAIVQAAYRSRFRHPHPNVVARYERRGIVLLRSDADGAVQVRLRVGEPPRIVRSRHDPARYWRVAVPP